MVIRAQAWDGVTQDGTLKIMKQTVSFDLPRLSKKHVGLSASYHVCKLLKWWGAELIGQAIYGY